MRVWLHRVRLGLSLWLGGGGFANAWASGAGEARPALWYLVPFSACAALGLAYYLYKSLLRKDEGNARMKEIALYVREGAMAYLRTQYAVVGRVFLVLALLLAGLAVAGIQNPFVPVAFLTGGLFSGLCGYIGMKAATHASVRTAQGARTSLDLALRIALRGGAVMGLVVVGFGLLDIALWYSLLNYLYDHDVMGFGLDLALKAGLTAPEWSESLTHMELWNQAKRVEITAIMITFGMGASTQALFARVGGGIYTKAADVGADLVGKVEEGIPEDDPRNPATIADNVGDNVGDVAGMGADLYESYCGSILSTAALGAVLPGMGFKAVIAPMLVASLGICFSMVGIFLVRTRAEAGPRELLRALLTGTLGATLLTLLSMLGLVYAGYVTWGVYAAVLCGLVAGVLIGQCSEYYTSDAYTPTRGIAAQARMGHATTIIDGLATGMFSAGLPVLIVVLAILGAYGLAGGFQSMAWGLYGVAFAAVGMLSTLGVTLATDAFGPIADNAGGNAEMAALPAQVRERTDALDMLGNTTAATGKGFAIGSAALTALALLAAYMEELKLWLGKLAHEGEGTFSVGRLAFVDQPGRLEQLMAGVPGGRLVEQGSRLLDAQGSLMGLVASTARLEDFAYAYNLTLLNPLLLGGLFLGSGACFVFCAFCLKAVGRSAGAMVEEVRRQFREIPGLREGKSIPDYARCVSIATRGAQREMLLPALLAVMLPVGVGLCFGVAGVVGLLSGALASGFALASMLNNAGGAWDNAKKYVEKGHYGGKGSPAHQAAVTGDTVGDPCKDTAGPALNILVKLMAMVSVVCVGLVAKFGEAFMGLFR